MTIGELVNRASNIVVLVLRVLLFTASWLKLPTQQRNPGAP